MIRVRNSRWWYDGSCRGRMLADLSSSKFVLGYREKKEQEKERENKKYELNLSDWSGYPRIREIKEEGEVGNM